MMDRRHFLQQGTAGSAGILAAWLGQPDFPSLPEAGRLALSAPVHGPAFAPLESLTVTGASPQGRWRVLDGKGQTYAEGAATESWTFQVGGHSGTHTLLWLDKKDRLLDYVTFTLQARTALQTDDPLYAQLLDQLYWTMVKVRGEAQTVWLGGKFYRYFVRWLRDHVHTLKGMKYFYPELASGIDLYADHQREDGMIWDNIYPRDQEKNWWDRRFRYGDFIRDIEEGRYEFKRIPVENDVEFLFVEGLYYTWKATGDTTWMQQRLDQAIKALDYSLTDAYRWSTQYQLLKRGFTIDTWDYQADADAARAGNDIMVVDLEKSYFGVMFGDNTGYVAACHYLAEMLDTAGRQDEAATFRQRGETLKARLDALAWTGTHYLHHVPETPAPVRDLGVDTATQVSLSNAYSLNRGLSQVQGEAIIRSYQQIRSEMPASSPGEWYSIYPPFARGFDGPSPPWEYMNGGVTPIVAGELARGAFRFGYPRYGVDILKRLHALAAETGGYLHCAYKGRQSEPPANRRFIPLDLSPWVSATFPHPEARYQGQPFASGAQDLHGIRVQCVQQNGKTALALSDRGGHLREVHIPVNRRAASLYLLHTFQGKLAGTLTLTYADGSRHVTYLDGATFGNWWHTPTPPAKNGMPRCLKAWRSDNDHYEALYLYGLDHPHPDRLIGSITLAPAAGSTFPWHVVALTLGEEPVWFDPGKLSYGIPDNWGAAAVVYALIEGLCGCEDSGIAFDQATLAPAWAATDVREAQATAHYPASGGYLAYHYRWEPAPQRLTLQWTGSAAHTRVRLLLPAGYTPGQARCNGQAWPFEVRSQGEARYLWGEIPQAGVHTLVLSS